MAEPAMIRLGVASALALTLAGCAYDYAQNSDRVGFSAGNAVKANLAAQTTNPSKSSQHETDGLGKDGVVLTPTIESDSETP